METGNRFFRTAVCFLLAMALGIAGTAFSEVAGSECLATTEKDLTGDGIPELLELYQAGGSYAVKAYLVTAAGNIELNLTEDLNAECLMAFGDALRDTDKTLAAACYAAALAGPTEEPTSEPAAEVTPESASASEPEENASVQETIPAGTRFVFGRFEQNKSGDGPDPIVWRVLDTDAEGNLLVMSEYGLITMKYNRKNVPTRWGESGVRNWLNKDFMASFTEDEQNLIVRKEISGSIDAVFILDAGEIRRYLREPYLCFATGYARRHGERGAYVNKDTRGSSWLVRMDATDKFINIVGGAGALQIPAEGSKVRNVMTTADNVVRPAMWVKPGAAAQAVSASESACFAPAKMKISTRSGPTTGYNGLGDYPIEGDLVKVISRVHDGSIWWLQIEFAYKGSLVRCYTGLKRVDIPIGVVPDEATSPIGTGTVVERVAQAYYGPGTMYKPLRDDFIPDVGVTGQIYAKENGYYFLEYQAPEYLVRIWLPESAVAVN